MSRLGFYFDANSCIGCKSCETGCTEWNGLPLGTRWRQVVSDVRGTFPMVARVNFSMACNNCNDAPCVRSCPTDALHVDGDLGLVALTQSKCIGCRYCEWACPYGALQFDAASKTMSKCTLCADRLAADLLPACVTSCPTGCLQFGDINVLQQAKPAAKPDFPGLEPSAYAGPNLLCEPLKHDPTGGD